MKDIYYNQCILCNVESCKFYNNNRCNLSEIQVGEDNTGTICASFQKKL